MHRLAIRMTVGAVLFAVIVFAVPTAFFASLLIWTNAQARLNAQADSLAKILEATPAYVLKPEVWLNRWIKESESLAAYARLHLPGNPDLESGTPLGFPRMQAVVLQADGGELLIQQDATETIRHIFWANLLVLLGALLLLGLSYFIAKGAAHRISAPLVFLAAQAQQIGSGQLRGRVERSGIEEIDLVQDELVRTSERLAERIAAERQFSKDASHQIRTPLTALSLRLEELEYLSDDPEILEEIRACSAQVERLTEVVDVLKSQVSQRSGGTGEALSVLEIFLPLSEEWEGAYHRAGRKLVFQDDSESQVMATPAALSQVLATILENSLKYGGGTTRVHAQSKTGDPGFKISVSDEGPGVADEIADKIFEKGFSGQGSSGLGLGIASALVQSDGGSLTLARRRPPVFLISLQAAPDSARRNQQNALVVAGRRRSRLH